MTSPMAAPLAFARLTTADELESLAGWDDLVRAMPRPSPFLLKGWLVEWWRHYLVGGARPAVIVGTRSGRLVAAAPVFVERRRGIRVAEFLGARRVVAGRPPGRAGRAVGGPAGAAGRAAARAVRLCGPLRGAAGIASRAIGPVSGGRARRGASARPQREAGMSSTNERTSSKRRSLHRRRLRQLGELGPVEFTIAREPDELEPRSTMHLRCTSCAGADVRTVRRSEPRPDGRSIVRRSAAWPTPTSRGSC